jgi:hypothetical protein
MPMLALEETPNRLHVRHSNATRPAVVINTCMLALRRVAQVILSKPLTPASRIANTNVTAQWCDHMSH